MEWVELIVQVGALGLLSGLLWQIFTKLIPSALDAYRESSSTHAATIKQITDGFTVSIKEQRAEFREEMRDERMCRQQEMAEVREGMQEIASQVRDLREKMT